MTLDFESLAFPEWSCMSLVDEVHAMTLYLIMMRLLGNN